MTVKELKKKEYFTRKQIEYPKDSQVYIRGEYDRETKKYFCYKWNDVNAYILLKGNTTVYTDFIF